MHSSLGLIGTLAAAFVFSHIEPWQLAAIWCFAPPLLVLEAVAVRIDHHSALGGVADRSTVRRSSGSPELESVCYLHPDMPRQKTPQAPVPSRANNWEIADWVINEEKDGKHTPDEILRIALSKTKAVNRSSLLNYLRVCKAFPPSKRPQGCTLAHMQILYKLPELTRYRFLERATVEGWGTRLLRERVAAWKREHPNLSESADELEMDADEKEHSKLQGYLTEIGLAAGYKVWIPAEDRGRVWRGRRLDSFDLADSLPDFDPGGPADTQETVKRIDVLWLKEPRAIRAAFEVERSTTIYSGLLRMADLVALLPNLRPKLYIVAPKYRLKQARKQANRPAFKNEQQDLQMYELCSFLPSEKLVAEADSLGPRIKHMGLAYMDDLSESLRLPAGESRIPQD